MAGARNMTSASWGLGVEMFGEIEDLANAGSFNDQVHSIDPTLFINFGDNDDEAKGHDHDEHKSKVDDDDEKGGPAPMAFSMNVGVQFGLTDATSDAAIEIPRLALVLSSSRATGP
jgi:hypothetical protein